MRTLSEIEARIAAKSAPGAGSFLGFDLDVLLPMLPFESARSYLKADAKAEDWIQSSFDDLVKQAEEYMAFALGKAANHRSISAGRSVEKMTEFVWLLGKDDLVRRIEANEIGYANYGAPILRAICREMGWPFPSEGLLHMMAEGLPCGSDSDCGCAR